MYDLIWTTDEPTRPGWYGFRTEGDDESDLMYFNGTAFFDVFGRVVKRYTLRSIGKYIVEWSGPLEMKN